MARPGGQNQRIIRWGAFGLAGLIFATAISGTADARSRHRRHSHHHAAAKSHGYEPPYSSIVVDGNSGATLQATNADAPRHPASLTKMMTLYLLFERLDAGKIKLNSEMPVSAHAAAQAPSKLGLRPGDSIRVENAIQAIVTKSANDVAVIIGEALGGDEPSFARMMTAKARALGMTHTTYRNASGLPNDEQVTTARDQALLGRALQDRFPGYFHYFSTRSFVFRGRTVRGHNRLLGSIDGVDGIKTGYINASGFNIVTSVNRGNRHIVAVVFGGHTARARDAKVRGLIDDTIRTASIKRTAPPIAEGATVVAEVKLPARPPAPSQDPRDEQAAVAAVDQPAPGSTDPIRPTAVKTVNVHPGAVRMAALSTIPLNNRRLSPAPATANPARVTMIATKKSELAAQPLGAPPGILGTLPAHAVGKSQAPVQVASAGDKETPVSTTEATARAARGGWMIQVGAFPNEDGAKERLSAAQTKAKQQLAEANPFTEKVDKGEKSLYRARFAGLDKGQAETACKSLKRSDIPCMMLRN